ncbi:MAG: helix-turn-helix domain-containing protein [Chloroflexi bacterium]|nr:helix-turn-helix domain-containing protein [Chloroflexota bacterium]
MTSPASSGLLSIAEAAARLGMTPARLRDLARQGKLPASKHAGRWLVESATLEQLEVPGAKKRERAVMAEGVAVSDMEHLLHGRGTIVSEPQRGTPAAPRTVQGRARAAQEKNLESLQERLVKPQIPERSI